MQPFEGGVGGAGLVVVGVVDSVGLVVVVVLENDVGGWSPLSRRSGARRRHRSAVRGVPGRHPGCLCCREGESGRGNRGPPAASVPGGSTTTATSAPSASTTAAEAAPGARERHQHPLPPRKHRRGPLLVDPKGRGHAPVIVAVGLLQQQALAHQGAHEPGHGGLVGEERLEVERRRRRRRSRGRSTGRRNGSSSHDPSVSKSAEHHAVVMQLVVPPVHHGFRLGAAKDFDDVGDGRRLVPGHRPDDPPRRRGRRRCVGAHRPRRGPRRAQVAPSLARLRRVGHALAKVRQDDGPAAVDLLLAVGNHRVERVHVGREHHGRRAVLLRRRPQHVPRPHRVGVRVHKHAVGPFPVATCSARLLVVALERLGESPVHDEAHVGLVDPHPERHGRDDDLGAAEGPVALDALALLGGEVGVVVPDLRGGAVPKVSPSTAAAVAGSKFLAQGLLQVRRDALALVARERVDDAALQLPARRHIPLGDEVRELLEGHCVLRRLLPHLVVQVGPVERRAEAQALADR